MLERDRTNQVEAVIGIVARIEADEMAAHNVLMKDALHLPINTPGAIGDTEGGDALKQVVGGIGRNLLPHHQKLLTHRDTYRSIRARRLQILEKLL